MREGGEGPYNDKEEEEFQSGGDKLKEVGDGNVLSPRKTRSS